jgi:hypothetical protein
MYVCIYVWMYVYTIYTRPLSVQAQYSIQLGWFTYIVLRSLRADPLKTPLATPVLLSRHVYVIIQASHGPLAAAQQKTVSYRCAITADVTRACADTKELLPQGCCVILQGYRVTAVAQCLEQIRHNIYIYINLILILTFYKKFMTEVFSI